eukprot:Amastigsp_a180628_222.p1 type:complete len:105 gc:universal Amastigsp_a180628_222:490-176(-)
MLAVCRALSRVALTPRTVAASAAAFASAAPVTESTIRATLETALAPSVLEVEDLSGGCGSMFRVRVVSAKFDGLSLLKQHRLVNELLASQIKSLHGLHLQTSAK